MGDSTSGTAYTIGISFAVNASNEAVFNSSSINPTPPDGSKTKIDDSGNITLAKKDSATISYSSATNGWSIDQLQLKDKDKSKWGKQSGSNRLTSNEADDYPDVPADSGTVSADVNGNLSISNTNTKSSTVDYRVSLKKGNVVVWSDPRIKDNGN